MIDRIQGFPADFGPQADQIREQAMGMMAAAQERLAEGSDAIKKYVHEQPARALGIALGVGVVLGWLIKRR